MIYFADRLQSVDRGSLMTEHCPARMPFLNDKTGLLTYTHTHACMHVQRTLQTYTGCDRNARKSKQLDLSERNKKKLPVSVFVSAIGQPLQKLPHLYS